MKHALAFVRNVYESLTKISLPFYDIFSDYNEYWKSDTIFIEMRKAMLIESGVEADLTMLDAGVGDGLISQYLMRKKNLKIFGLDISSFVCEKATKRGIPTEVRDISNGLGLDSLLQELRW